MAIRRPLTAGVNKIEHENPEAVRAFVTQTPSDNSVKDNSVAEIRPKKSGKQAEVFPEDHAMPTADSKPERKSCLIRVGLVPVTVRLQPEIASALKRVSLERQLAGMDVYSQQDILEEVLEPWLKKEGVL